MEKLLGRHAHTPHIPCIVHALDSVDAHQAIQTGNMPFCARQKTIISCNTSRPTTRVSLGNRAVSSPSLHFISSPHIYTNTI